MSGIEAWTETRAKRRGELSVDPERPPEWDLLTPEQVVELFPGLAPSVGALKAQRRRGRGPRYLKLGGLVRYRRLDVLRYLESCVVGTATDPIGGDSE